VEGTLSAAVQHPRVVSGRAAHKEHKDLSHKGHKEHKGRKSTKKFVSLCVLTCSS
jgi:hypothetical protein